LASQAVLNYDAVVSEGHSLNYWGAMKMNPLAAYVYEHAWRLGHSYNWNNSGTHPILPPNILLLDFAGYFDGFPEACIRMLRITPLGCFDLQLARQSNQISDARVN